MRGADYAAGIAGMKKAEATAYAERAIKGSGWLPPMVRITQDLDDKAAPDVSSEAFSVAAE